MSPSDPLASSAALPDSAKSPCVGVCTVNDQECCVGCHRTLDEIGRWMRMSIEEREAVNQRVAQRRNR